MAKGASNQEGDRIKDYPSMWHYIKADSERLENHTKRARSYRRNVYKWLADYKTARGCMDCGYNEHPAALQLDHTGPKVAAISELRTSIKRIEKEIEKGQCVVRCANCHAIKTWCNKTGVEYNGQI